jgi:hypothetical protein
MGRSRRPARRGGRAGAAGLAIGVLALVLAWVLVPSPSIADQRPVTTDRSHAVQQLAVPAYINPVADGASWVELGTAPPGRVGIVVANVANGPGSAPEPAWAAVIARAHASGQRVLGYVDTGYLGSPSPAHPYGLPTRSGALGPEAWLSQIDADIAAWYQFYGADLAGIFLDQGTGHCGPVTGSNQYADQYRTIRDDLRMTRPAALTVLNPGAPVPSCYREAADVLVTFEGSYANYTGTPDRQGRDYEPLRWTGPRPGQIWHIIYGATTTAELTHAMALSRERGAGYVYVTDAGLPNPFGTLPPAEYWSAEQTLLDPSGP